MGERGRVQLPWRSAVGPCSACGAQLTGDAVWCGGCGARAAGAARDDEGDAALVRDEDVAGAAPTSTVVGRRLTAVMVLGLVVALVAGVALREPPPEAVLGQAGSASGVTATGLPPDGLRLTWSQALAEEPWWDDLGVFVADGDLARLGSVVVDVTSGEVVRLAERHHVGTGRYATNLSNGQVVVVDDLRGTVVTRIDLPDLSITGPLWPSARTGEVTLLGGQHGTALVRDDGTVVAEHPGWHEGWQGPHGPAPGAVPVWSDAGLHGEAAGDLRLVSMRDGAVLLRRETDAAAGTTSVDVMGDRVLLAAPVPDEGPWLTSDVELVDATTGEVLAARRFSAQRSPRIVGRTPEGGTLVAVEYDEAVEVWEVAAGGDGFRLRTAVDRESWGADDARGGVLTHTASLNDEGMVIELVAQDRVEARTLDGETVWRVGVPPSDGLRTDGGVVALVPEPDHSGDGAPATIPLLDATDGSRLGTVRTAPGLQARHWGSRPAAVVGGAVAVGHVAGWPSAAIAEVGHGRWFALDSGEPVPTADVLAPWVDDDVGLGGELWLSGMTQDPGTGEQSPGLFLGSHGSTLRVLQDGVAVEHELAMPEGSEAYVQPVGATADRLAVVGEMWDPRGSFQATFLVDRVSGRVVQVDGVVGTLLTDDVLVGVARAADEWYPDAPLVGIDPATGQRRWTGPAVGYGFDPTLHDGRVALVGDGHRRMAVDLADGTVLWTHDPAEELVTGGVLGPRQVLLATTTGTVVAIDRASGAERWRRDLGAPITSLSGAGDGAVVGTLAEELVVLDGEGVPVQRVALEDVPLHAVALGTTVVVQYRDRVVGLHPDGPGFTTQDEVDLP